MLRTAAILLMGVPFFVRAQAPSVVPYVIKDARVVVSADEVLPKATVVLRNGLITAVGADVSKLPADAIVIDGAGLTVYPGLIEAAASTGFDASARRPTGGPFAPEDLQADIAAATRTENRKGFTPEFEVRSAILPLDESALAWRRIGMTSRLLFPEGGYFSGQSAFVSLSGLSARDSMIRPAVFQHAALKTLPGSEYPRSLMGVFAHARQALLDTAHHRKLLDAFEKQPTAVGKIPFDPALEALAKSIGGGRPFVFEADRRDEIHRALDFAGEFGLKPIIFGGRDAWKAKDRLKAADVPVILRIAYSEAPEKEAELPERIRRDRERQRREERACAGELRRAGVRVAICGHGLAGDKPWEKFRENLSKAIGEGLAPAEAIRALTLAPADILGVADRYGKVAANRPANLVVCAGDLTDPGSKIRWVFVDGIAVEVDAGKKDPPKKVQTAKKDTETKTTPKPGLKPMPVLPEPIGDRTTEIEIDRVPSIRTGGNVLISGATVLTAARPPRIERADILVKNGKIAAVEAHLKDRAFSGTVIAADGMFVMPGIIDTHAHFAINGGVNETSMSVVPEVRVRDVIDSEDVQIYRAAAGGVTAARLLHGSANVIGGQDAVIKLKYGRTARELLIADAPRGVKFALGENVKRTDGRFPNSRMGVEAVMVRAFTEATEYRERWDAFRRSNGKLPEPRRDLRLEALADVLRGDLLVHCHCYRSDEILMLLRTADRFGVKVKSLQHVLEGYKVAPEIAAHGAYCSLFADWWGYKIEAFDAIPYAAALMEEGGVKVCLKSDSNELVRHLYQDAAKLIKYGGMSEAGALKTITLNAAEQLGLQHRIGSIEVGKDADLAIFNGHPLNGFSRCEMTLIDGEVFFQRSDVLRREPAAAVGPTVPQREFTMPKIRPGTTMILRNVEICNPGKAPILADVRIVGNRIDAVARGLDTEGHLVLNCRGLRLYPGMIDAGTVLGLTELGMSKETHDFADGGDFQPDLRAAVAVNPESELIPVTRANGITSVVTRPTGPVVAGQAALINLAGWVPKEMAIVEQWALHVDFPHEFALATGDPSAPNVGRALAKKQREEKIRKLRDLFDETRRYEAALREDPSARKSPRLEAMIPYVNGVKPVVVTANREADIRDALKLADELKFKLILSGAVESWKVTEEIKKRDVPVIVGPMMVLPQDVSDPYDAPYACPSKLARAGIRYCIRSAGGNNSRNLPYEAAMAVAHGLPVEDALTAVTLGPAKILGVEAQLGSIDIGKRANLVLATGDLLQPSTQVVGLFINGRAIDTSNKQTRLYEKYRERLQEVKDGKAPLGTK